MIKSSVVSGFSRTAAYVVSGFSRTIASTFAVGIFIAIASTSAGIAQQAPAAAAGQQPPAGGRQGGGQGQGRGPAPVVDTLGAGPWEFAAGRGGRIKVSVVTKGLDHPWGMAFVPDPSTPLGAGGTILVTERPGRLRVVRNGVLDPTPIGPLPEMAANGLGGLMDVSLHPQFAQNRLLYFAYSKKDPNQCATQRECSATLAIARARWDGGSTLTDLEDIIVTDAWHGAPGTPQNVGPASGSFGSRLAWDKNGLLYITSGDRNYGIKAQDPMSHIGKILRLRDDGTVPPDNPFVGKAGYKPEIYTLGHRNPLGLAFHPTTGELWSTEQGPQGGDELNRIVAGKNYGWPEVSLGRNYDGTVVGKGFSAPGFEEPVVFWVPAIAISGLSFYDGDKFPNWKGQAMVGAMRNGTGKYIHRVTFNAKALPTGREAMLAELNQRIRDVRPGPDGAVYVLTDETAGAMLKIEPAP